MSLRQIVAKGNLGFQFPQHKGSSCQSESGSQNKKGATVANNWSIADTDFIPNDLRFDVELMLFNFNNIVSNYPWIFIYLGDNNNTFCVHSIYTKSGGLI